MSEAKNELIRDPVFDDVVWLSTGTSMDEGRMVDGKWMMRIGFEFVDVGCRLTEVIEAESKP